MIHSFKMIGFRTTVNGTNVINCIKAYPLLNTEINELDCMNNLLVFNTSYFSDNKSCILICATTYLF